MKDSSYTQRNCVSDDGWSRQGCWCLPNRGLHSFIDGKEPVANDLDCLGLQFLQKDLYSYLLMHQKETKVINYWLLYGILVRFVSCWETSCQLFSKCLILVVYSYYTTVSNSSVLLLCDCCLLKQSCYVNYFSYGCSCYYVGLADCRTFVAPGFKNYIYGDFWILPFILGMILYTALFNHASIVASPSCFWTY